MGLTEEEFEKIKGRFRTEVPRPYTILNPRLKEKVRALQLSAERERRLLQKIAEIPQL